MKKLDNVLKENPYLRECKDTIFTVIVRNTLHDSLDHDKIKSKSFIHGLLSYTTWSKNTDLFQYLTPDALQKLKNKDYFFVFDASTEGFDPVREMPFFDLLYFNCEKYGVSPSQIIYTSANLADETNIEKYVARTKKEPIHVFSFPSFEQVLSIDGRMNRQILEHHFQTAHHNCAMEHRDKMYSSLSRVNRYYRTMAQFLLSRSDVNHWGLISHDKVHPNLLRRIKEEPHLHDIPEEDYEAWLNRLPMIVDNNDFNRNWALDTPYRHIHDQTLFQIVNETSVSYDSGSVMFFSEKTFRPVAYFQPFLIYGNPGANRHLRKLGYYTYEDWFEDMSFDDEIDPVIRYRKLLEVVRNTCHKLDKMNTRERVEWRFKRTDILKHNFETMVRSDHTMAKIKQFLTDLDNKL